MRNLRYKVTVPPVKLPVTFADFQRHIGEDPLDLTDQALIESLIAAATGYVENYTGLDLITRTNENLRDCFPCTNDPRCFGADSSIKLERSPLQTVDLVQYIDTNDATQTVASSVYYVTDNNPYSKIVLNDDQSWPSDVKSRQQAVTITFKTGFGDNPADVPIDLRQVILMMTANLLTNKGDCNTGNCGACVTGGGNAMLELYKIVRTSFC